MSHSLAITVLVFTSQVGTHNVGKVFRSSLVRPAENDSERIMGRRHETWFFQGHAYDRILNRIRTSGCAGRVSTDPFYCNVIGSHQSCFPWPTGRRPRAVGLRWRKKATLEFRWKAFNAFNSQQFVNAPVRKKLSFGRFPERDFTDSRIRTMRRHANFILLRPTSLTAFEIVDSEVLLIGA